MILTGMNDTANMVTTHDATRLFFKAALAKCRDIQDSMYKTVYQQRDLAKDQ